MWAGDEIKKRTNGKYEIQVFPASSLGKESDINQGLHAGHGGHHPHRRQLRRATRYKPLAITYFPFIFRDAEHLLKYAKSDVFKELAEGYDEGQRQPHHGADLLRRAPCHRPTGRSPSPRT